MGVREESTSLDCCHAGDRSRGEGCGCEDSRGSKAFEIAKAFDAAKTFEAVSTVALVGMGPMVEMTTLVEAIANAVGAVKGKVIRWLDVATLSQ